MQKCFLFDYWLNQSESTSEYLITKIIDSCSPFLLASLVSAVLTLLISWKWAWWMFVVRPQHLVLKRINAEVAPRMETVKKGDFFLDQSKDWTTQDLHIWGFNFAFLSWLYSVVLLSFPGTDFWHTLHSRSLVTVTETQRAQHSALCPVPDCLTTPLWKPSLPCNVCE